MKHSSLRSFHQQRQELWGLVSRSEGPRKLMFSWVVGHVAALLALWLDAPRRPGGCPSQAWVSVGWGLSELELPSLGVASPTRRPNSAEPVPW